MRTFPLRIGTPDGLLFEGEVQRIVCRSITGDLAILAGHCNFCTALGMGEAHVILENGTSRSAACIGGMLTVMDGNCSLLATTWEWQGGHRRRPRWKSQRACPGKAGQGWTFR